MNKHILLVMKWLKDKDSVSQEELEKNRSAAAAAFAYADTHYNDYAAAASDYAVAYANTANVNTANTAKWVDRYFKHTGEDKQAYINELEKQ